jgi:uncharacterized protein YjbI with pentapeptide repeats
MRLGWRPYKSTLTAVLLAVPAVTLVVLTTALLVRWAPEWLTPKHGLSVSDIAVERARVRTALLAIAGGLVACTGLLYTARTFRLNRTGQITERFTRAFEQLGHPQLQVRIGGVYALEQIASESRLHHPSIMDILAGYLREHARVSKAEEGPQTMIAKIREGVPPQGALLENMISPQRTGIFRTLPLDVQAAASALSRRNSDYDSGMPFQLPEVDLRGITLSGDRLCGVNFAGANLAYADLHHTNLSSAELSETILSGAFLAYADLSRTELVRADLTRTCLMSANLEWANLWLARLEGVNLFAARLKDATLTKADLFDAWLLHADLTKADLKGANLTESHFANADLSGAQLHFAVIDHTDFTDARLNCANLSFATIRNADFTGASLNELVARGAFFETGTVLWPADFDPAKHGVRPLTA